jgi:hypothetical protein
MFPENLPVKYANESLLQINTNSIKTSQVKVPSKNLGNPNAKPKGSEINDGKYQFSFVIIQFLANLNKVIQAMTINNNAKISLRLTLKKKP